ncbi:MAG TPA: diacylglycerol kinase [Steroidobacteraceae bacterium]|nr:diacylglycerol kinase [Steroidobacteraceae bacterium]
MTADPHKYDKTTGFRHLRNAALNSLRGIGAAWRNETAFRQASTMTVLLSPVGIWLGTSGVERALLVGSLLLMLIIELLNSGVEAVVDRVGLERHELSGIAKDVASAAVALAIVNAVVVWVLILWPHYGPKLFSQ